MKGLNLWQSSSTFSIQDKDHCFFLTAKNNASGLYKLSKSTYPDGTNLMTFPNTYISITDVD